jgi:hypothetical protein
LRERKCERDERCEEDEVGERAEMDSLKAIAEVVECEEQERAREDAGGEESCAPMQLRVGSEKYEKQ